ncbi:hypothetical protein [Planomicrobium sp. Y74]|uniref:hypothetical protein n=1 Tax=Planomicrobium sp. Y74 TaxID=2478977 RepID=UPI000EF4969F|nr:hypothetical protein [Planomicrobium sp. Y74]RLQ91428.1 hypothetical protein D9754_06785 [Planomicrobium sp. Y74]
MEKAGTPIVIGLDEKSWKEKLDKVEKWFDQLLMIQSSFKKLAEQTADKIGEIHIKTIVLAMVDEAEEHERQIGELYKVIGRDPSSVRKKAGELMGKMSDTLDNLQSMLGGTTGYWKELHQLHLLNLNAMSAFGMAEQLGLALGLTEVVDIVFPILHDKQKNHMMLQEYTLEIGAVSVLYDRDFG